MPNPFLLPINESDRVEFKTSFNEDVIVTLVAFSNTKGGVVYIGVSDNGEVCGTHYGKETLASWVNEIKSKTAPAIIPDMEEISIKDKQVVCMGITEYPVKPVSTRGRYYRRIGNSNHLLSVTEVVDIHLQSMNSSWDYYIDSIHSIDQISFEKVQAAIDIMGQNHLTINEDPLSFLQKYDLVRENKLTNAAYLLFKKTDSAITAIELGRFQNEILIKDTARTKADVLLQIEQVLDFVKKHINREVVITGDARNVQKWQYPMEAIREIVINMIVHRDYRSSSDSIVKIFDDKIEFYNPGRLPDNITIEDLLTNNYRSTPRNKLIADFFKDLGLIEKYGSGIGRIINCFTVENFQLPTFQNISDGFMVTVYSVKVTDVSKDVLKDVLKDVSKEDRTSALLSLLKEDPDITMDQLAQKCSVNIKTIQRDLERLKSKSRVKRVGGRKNGHWEVTLTP